MVAVRFDGSSGAVDSFVFPAGAWMSGFLVCASSCCDGDISSVSCICTSCAVVASLCSAPVVLAASSSSSQMWNRVTSRRSSRSNAGTNSFGKRTCSESNCLLVASDTLLSGLVLALAFAFTAAWSIDGGAASESSSCVTKWRLEGRGDTGDAIVTRNGMSAWCCVELKMT